jgi:hypothetical protein
MAKAREAGAFNKGFGHAIHVDVRETQFHGAYIEVQTMNEP